LSSWLAQDHIKDSGVASVLRSSSYGGLTPEAPLPTGRQARMTVEEMEQELKQLLEEAKVAIAQAGVADLQLVEARLLGRKSPLSEIMASLGNLSPEERKQIGILINQVKAEIVQLLEAKKQEIFSIKQKSATERDTTIPGIKPEVGHLSPLTYINRELVDIFKELGFEVAEGPEAETE